MATRKKNDTPPPTPGSGGSAGFVGQDGQGFAELMQQMAHLPQISPAAIAQLQADYLQQATALWNASLGQGEAPAVGDRRFAAPEWRANPSVQAASEIWSVRDPSKFAAMRAPLALSHPELDDFCDDYTAGYEAFAVETGKRHVIIEEAPQT